MAIGITASFHAEDHLIGIAIGIAGNFAAEVQPIEIAI